MAKSTEQQNKENQRKMTIDIEGFEKMYNKTFENMEEERDLALDRYRRQDDMMTSAQDFVLQGKNAVEFLKTAADRTNSMVVLTKMVKEILFKNSPESDGNSQGGTSGSGISDEMKRELAMLMKDSKKEG